MSLHDLDLLNTALEAVMGIKHFVSEKEYHQRNADAKTNVVTYQPVDWHSFHQSNVLGKDGDLKIFVKSTNKNFPVFADQDWSVDGLKLKIQEELGVAPDQQILNFNEKQLQDGKTLAHYNVQNDSVIYLSLKPRGSQRVISYLNSDSLHPGYNFDFTNIDDGPKAFFRGGVPYQRPCGWQRFALQVVGKYDNGGNQWLGVGQDSWPVSYHGTGKSIYSRSIAQDGYLFSRDKKFPFGHGIYSTPDLNVAERYAQEFEFKGEKYVMLIQNRVNPVGLQKIEDHTTGIGGKYWISQRVHDVRPYGVCIKKKDEKKNYMTSYQTPISYQTPLSYETPIKKRSFAGKLKGFFKCA